MSINRRTGWLKEKAKNTRKSSIYLKVCEHHLPVSVSRHLGFFLITNLAHAFVIEWIRMRKWKWRHTICHIRRKGTLSAIAGGNPGKGDIRQVSFIALYFSIFFWSKFTRWSPQKRTRKHPILKRATLLINLSLQGLYKAASPPSRLPILTPATQVKQDGVDWEMGEGAEVVNLSGEETLSRRAFPIWVVGCFVERRSFYVRNLHIFKKHQHLLISSCHPHHTSKKQDSG